MYRVTRRLTQCVRCKVALALGHAPLKFQPELARLAVQNDFTEKKALLLAEQVRDRVGREGEAALDVGQMAAAQRLLPVTVSPDSLSVMPELAGGEVYGPSADAPDTLAPKADTTMPAAPILVSKRRKNGRGRVPERPLTADAAMNGLRAYFPSLELRSVRRLADLAVKHGLNEKTLLLAGLFVLEGEQEPAEAVKSVLSLLPLTPDLRAQLNTLDMVARQYDLIERGQFDEKAERLLQLQLWVAKQPGRVKQAAAQARRKTVA